MTVRQSSHPLKTLGIVVVLVALYGGMFSVAVELLLHWELSKLSGAL